MKTERNGKTDYYGLDKNPKEVDSDVNEDNNREALLDSSFEDFYEHIDDIVKQKNNITNVPRSNVFDAASELDAEP